MTIAYVPLSPTDYDSVRTVNLDGSVYSLRVYLNTRNNAWYMDLNDSAENVLVQGQRLNLGVDLLATCRKQATSPPGYLFMSNQKGDFDATLANLNVDVFLCYASLADLEQIVAGTYVG